MSMQRYEQYIDSEIEWLGEIPAHWEIKRLKSIFSFGKGLNITKENLINNGIPVINYGQVHSKFNTGTYVNNDIIKYVNEDYLISNKKSLVHKNDFIFADTSEDLVGVGNCAFIDIESTIFAGYHSIILKAKDEDSKKYIAYLFLTDSWRFQIRSLVSGIKVYSITKAILSQTNVLFPPIQEQEAIAKFLDTKCEQIDRAIAQKERVIELLNERRQIIIQRAVTRGLNPDVELKDSGIDWIGEIPRHWEVKRLKSLFTFGKGLNITKENLQDYGVPVINYGQIHSKLNNGTEINDKIMRYVSEEYLIKDQRSLVYKNDFIFADTSEDIKGVGNCAFIDIDSNIFAGYHSIILKSKDKHNKKYLAYLFLTDCWRSQIRSLVSGIKVFSITKAILSKSSVIYPFYSEQQEIANYLDNISEKIDKAISLKKEEIAKLKEYKQTLINSAVTGKIKIA